MRTPTVHRANLCLLVALLGLAFTLLASPSRADDLRDGRAALQAGRLDDAIRLFESAATQGQAEGRAGVGLVWLRRHQLSKAAEAFDLAEKMDSQLALAQYGLGEVLRQQEKCEEAVSRLQRAAELDRRFPEAQLSLSDCLRQLKRYPEAVAAAYRGLNWGARWRPKFLIALGNVAASRDSLRDASIWYTTAVQESPEDPATHRALGDFYVRRGTFELAYPEYQAAVFRDSADVELRFALGQALYYGQRYNDALEEYQWVTARDPEFAPGQLALGDLLYRSGKADPKRYGEARAPLEKYTQLNPDDPKGWSLLGRTYYFLALSERNEAYKEQALTALDRAESLGDKNKELYTVRARLQIDRREFDKAAADYGCAGSDIAPEDMYRLARMMVIQKNTAKAESLYLAIVARDSTTRLAGIVLTEVGKIRYGQAAELARTDKAGAVPLHQQAIGIFQRRIALDPNNDEAYYYIGLSYKEMSQYPEALEALRQAAALGGARADRHFWLAIMYQQLYEKQADSLAVAEREFQMAVDLDTTASGNKALALRQLGYFRLLRRENADAVRLLDQSVQINPRDVQALVWLAQGHQNSGNRAGAIENYRRVLQIDARNESALTGLKSIQGGAK